MRAFIGIGSNMGDRRSYIERAVRELNRLPATRLVRLSSIYETPPEGAPDQGPYLNAVAELQTELSPQALLQELQRLEQEAGRPPVGQRPHWAARTLDLDILLLDEQIISSQDLIVPHPRMHERWFVLKPLAELDPHLVHPVLQITVGRLLERLEAARRS